MKKPIPTRDVCNFLNNLNIEKVFKQIWSKILILLKEPNQQDSIKIGEYNNNIVYRNNVGEYRIIYYFDDKFLYLMLIGKRNDDEIYKKFIRKIKK